MALLGKPQPGPERLRVVCPQALKKASSPKKEAEPEEVSDTWEVSCNRNARSPQSPGSQQSLPSEVVRYVSQSSRVGGSSPSAP